MSNKLREIFIPAPEEMKKTIKELRRREIERIKKAKVDLEPYDADHNLYRADPFVGFYGDCSDCSHYDDFGELGATEGQCNLKGIRCGHGYICPKNDAPDRETALQEAERIEE